jgi:hypothetical protein
VYALRRLSPSSALFIFNPINAAHMCMTFLFGLNCDENDDNDMMITWPRFRAAPTLITVKVVIT